MATIGYLEAMHVTLKEELLQTIDTAPESVIEQTLIDLKTLLQKQSSLRPSSRRSLLRHARKWQGDDFEDTIRPRHQQRSPVLFTEFRKLNPYKANLGCQQTLPSCQLG